jgi:selenide,water dikinase
MKRLLLVGGGHAHVEVLRRLRFAPIRDSEIVLVSPARYTAYSGMVPGLIAGHYSRRDAHIDLERLSHAARVRFVQDHAVSVAAARNTVTCAQGTELVYDILSLDVGSVADTAPIGGAERSGLPVKPVDRLLAGVEALLEDARHAALAIAVIGAGAGGIELCFALDYRVRREASAQRGRFAIVSASSEVLPGYGDAVRRRVLRVLKQREIAVHTDRRVTGADEHGIVLEGGERIPADRVVWVTGPASVPWLQGSGLALDAKGFVLINDRLQSISHERVFAAGDAATMNHHPRPKSGVYAVRQGPPLAHNLRCALQGTPLMSFQPQRRALQLITTGERYAIAAWGELACEGRWVWRWKDWIDRRFIARYA